eukprot:TRINITY_DN3843_c0_g1_i2.p1 TRINITY_DN3843_c0_g1~~TRINITY_DN3843_c0_g1_i2.p1  ORF type:complete len:869 (-),score=194.35 TRINITY_DN3843_c0_g1_i2:1490-4096(-)
MQAVALTKGRGVGDPKTTSLGRRRMAAGDTPVQASSDKKVLAGDVRALLSKTVTKSAVSTRPGSVLVHRSGNDFARTQQDPVAQAQIREAAKAAAVAAAKAEASNGDTSSVKSGSTAISAAAASPALVTRNTSGALPSKPKAPVTVDGILSVLPDPNKKKAKRRGPLGTAGARGTPRSASTTGDAGAGLNSSVSSIPRTPQRAATSMGFNSSGRLSALDTPDAKGTGKGKGAGTPMSAQQRSKIAAQALSRSMPLTPIKSAQPGPSLGGSLDVPDGGRRAAQVALAQTASLDVDVVSKPRTVLPRSTPDPKRRMISSLRAIEAATSELKEQRPQLPVNLKNGLFFPGSTAKANKKRSSDPDAIYNSTTTELETGHDDHSRRRDHDDDQDDDDERYRPSTETVPKPPEPEEEEEIPVALRPMPAPMFGKALGKHVKQTEADMPPSKVYAPDGKEPLGHVGNAGAGPAAAVGAGAAGRKEAKVVTAAKNIITSAGKKKTGKPSARNINTHIGSKMNRAPQMAAVNVKVRGTVGEPDTLCLSNPLEPVRLDNPRQAGFTFSALNTEGDYMQLARTAKRQGQLDREALIYYNVALNYDNNGNFDQAVELYKKHLSLSRQLGDVTSEAVAINHIACVYQEMENEESVEEACQMHDALLASYDPLERAVSLYNLGLCAEWRQDTDAAFNYYEGVCHICAPDHEAYAFDTPVPPPLALQVSVLSWVRRGVLSRENGDHVVAMKCLGHARELSRICGGPHQAIANHTLGSLAYEMGDVVLADECMDETLLVADVRDAALACQESGQKANTSADFEAAARHFELAWRLAGKCGDVELQNISKCSLGVAQGNLKLLDFLQGPNPQDIESLSRPASSMV